VYKFLLPTSVDVNLAMSWSTKKTSLAFFGVVIMVAGIIAVTVVLTGTSSTKEVELSDYKKKPFGDVLIMRHATAPGGGDPPMFDLNNCSTQRNLDQSGINMARKIGEDLSKSGIHIGSVIYSSQWCRCLDTAKVIAAELNSTRKYTVESSRGLNSFYQPELGGFTKDTCLKWLDEDILNKLKTMPLEEKGALQVLMVTHKVTVAAVTGIQVDSGGIVAYNSATGESKLLNL
jgi:hypothetical protein